MRLPDRLRSRVAFTACALLLVVVPTAFAVDDLPLDVQTGPVPGRVVVEAAVPDGATIAWRLDGAASTVTGRTFTVQRNDGRQHTVTAASDYEGERHTGSFTFTAPDPVRARLAAQSAAAARRGIRVRVTGPDGFYRATVRSNARKVTAVGGVRIRDGSAILVLRGTGLKKLVPGTRLPIRVEQLQGEKALSSVTVRRTYR